MAAEDKYSCAELIQAWALYRDQAKWPELLDTFAAQGEIAVSWFSGSFREFVERCREAVAVGQRSKHHLFPSLVRIVQQRAVAETSVLIRVRQSIEGVLADLTSHARFLDRLERGQRGWVILERAAIYERDRLDAVEPSAEFDNLFARLDVAAHPEPYRYLAARLKAAGRPLAPVIHHDGAPHTTALYQRYESWLDRGAASS